MKRIEVRGMLVGAEYDDPFMHREVENGIFTPSSKVIREIDEANGDDIEIFVDSEGGDVFAFHSALDKILNYPGNITFMIGATAFSEAANFVLLSKRPVKCYPFSVMLFHSAMSTVYDGAAGELRSEADILEKINAPVKWALKMHGIPESEVEEGFRDGCALVLGMDDLVKYGIATVVEEEAPVTKRLDESISMRLVALAEANQRIAAHYSAQVNNIKEDKMSKKSRKAQKATKAEETEEQKLLEEETQEQQTAEETVPEETKQEEQPVEETQQEEAPAEEQQQEEAPSEEQPAEENKPEEETEEVAEEDAPAEEEKPEEDEAPEAEESDDDKLLETLETLQGSVSALTDRLNALEEKLTEKEVELQDAKKALKAERTKRIGALAAAVSGKAGDTGPKDWPAAVKACKGDKLEAYKKYPELARAWAKPN